MEGIQLCEIFNSSTEEEDMEEDEDSSNEADSSCNSSLELESQDEMCMKSFQSYVVESGLVFQGPLQQGVQDTERGRMGAAVSGGDQITTNDSGAYHPVPLKSVKVEAALVHAVAQVQLTQIYRNDEETTIDAVYFFPVDSNGAVTHFHAELDGKIIKGVIKPKLGESTEPGNPTSVQENAESCPKSSLCLTGEEENNPGIFKVSIGHLKAGQEVKVVLGYVTEVKNEPDSHSMRFFLPTAITPKRVPRHPTKICNSGHCSTQQGRKDVLEMVDEPVAPLSIKVITSIQGAIRSVSCSTHEVVVENKGEIALRPMWHKAIVTFDGLITDLDRDFILIITPEEQIKPRLYAETLPNGSTTVMTYFVPSFKLDEQKTELFIVVDRSESMSGKNVEIIKESLKLLLHSLPSDCYFNIVGFGSRHHFLFKRGSRRCSDQSLKDATDYVNKIQANMGGTEFIAILRNIYEKPLIPGYFRQTIILTDGIVCDPDTVIGLVKVNAHISRIFAIGIGSAPSHHLLESISKAGNGTCAFIESDSSICKATLPQLKNLLQPSLNDVKIVWEGVAQPQTPEKTLDGFVNGMKLATDDTEESKNCMYPRKIPPIFDGVQFLVFGLFEGDEKPTGARITACSTSGPLSLDLKLSEENDLGKTKMLHRLSAVKMIRELKLEECAARFLSRPRREQTLTEIKKKIVKVAVTNGISSKYTSFVATDGPCKDINCNCLSTRTLNTPSEIQFGYNHLKKDGSGQVKCCGKMCGFRVEKTLRLHLGIQRLEHCGGKRPLTNGCTSAGVKNKKKLSPSKKFRREETDIEPMDTTTMDDIHDEIRTEEHSLLQTLTGLQCSQGSFPLNSSFASLLSIDLENLKEESKNKKWDESAWATVLAIQFFKTKLLAFKDLWDFVAAKSQKWSISNHLNSTIAMMSRAKVLLKQNPSQLTILE